ncbi:MAG: ATP-binding protein [Oscillospiraceae bacterium]
MKNTYKKFYSSTAVATIGVAIMGILNIVFAMLFFGKDGSYTMGIALPIVIFTEIITYFFGIGGGIALSIRQGKGEKQEASQIFSVAVFMTLLIGIIVALIGVLLLPMLLPMLGAKTSTDQAIVIDYLRILFCGMPSILLCGVMNVFIRNDNNPHFAMIGIVTSVLTNLALIALFIGVLKLPIYSIALATVLSNFVCTIMYIGYFISKKSTIKFAKKIRLKAFFDICEPGFAGSMIFLAQTILTVVINNVLLDNNGAAGIATYGIVKYTITFIYTIYDSVNHSAQPMFSVYYGEKDSDSIKLTAKISYNFILFCSAALSVTLILVAPIISNLFAMNVTSAIRIIGISCLFSGTVAFLNSYYRSTEKSKLSIFFIILDNLLLPALLIWCLVYKIGFVQNGVWLALLLSEVLTLIVIAIVTKGRFLKLDNIKTTDDKIYQTLILNEEANIIGINEEIENFCEANGVDKKKQYYIFLCIEEIAVNIIKHGFNDGKEHYIDIRIIAGENVMLNIRDDATEFDPTAKKDADITTSAEERDIGGLGIYLVKKIAKEFSYKRVIGFNNLHIVL